MRYFDSRETKITANHVMASGALPPAFPAIRIDGELYWAVLPLANPMVSPGHPQTAQLAATSLASAPWTRSRQASLAERLTPNPNARDCPLGRRNTHLPRRKCGILSLAQASTEGSVV
jgi:predicted acylesterase/phospholipase RssA